MRQATAWVGCLALVLSVGCRGSAPAPAETRGAGGGGLAGACVGTTCTIILKEAGGVCSVVPMKLPIDSGTTVIFATQVSSQTARVVITPKVPPPPVTITFSKGPPTSINRGAKHDSGAATGAMGAQYTYAARFVGSGGPDICPVIDPEICIKPGTMDVDNNCT